MMQRQETPLTFEQATISEEKLRCLLEKATRKSEKCYEVSNQRVASNTAFPRNALATIFDRAVKPRTVVGRSFLVERPFFDRWRQVGSRDLVFFCNGLEMTDESVENVPAEFPVPVKGGTMRRGGKVWTVVDVRKTEPLSTEGIDLSSFP
jgi:hypothetical protein